MASRTRIHCPNCNTQYLPRARKCENCGRARDQLSDQELQYAETMKQVKQAAATPARRAVPFAPPRKPLNPWAIAAWVLGLFMVWSFLPAVALGVFAGAIFFAIPGFRRFSMPIGIACTLFVAGMITLGRNMSTPAPQRRAAIPPPPVRTITAEEIRQQKIKAQQDAKIEQELLKKDARELEEARAWQRQQELSGTVHNAAAQQSGPPEGYYEALDGNYYPQGSYGYSYYGSSGTHVGPRGGVFHYGPSGKKVYESSGRSSGRRRRR